MHRTILVRLVAMAALVVSALLTVDLANPGRSFCPIDAACEQARESALGTILSVPTSVLGMAAFGVLFLLTLLPVDKARRALMPAGFLAILGGFVFIAFQAYWLRSFCPLCLVADCAGILVGLLALSWPRPTPYSWRGRLPAESRGARVLWTVAAMMAVLLPMNWPRPAEKGWVEIAPVVDLDERWFPDLETLAAGGGGPAESAGARDARVPEPQPAPQADPAVREVPAEAPNPAPPEMRAVPPLLSLQAEHATPEPPPPAPETPPQPARAPTQPVQVVAASDPAPASPPEPSSAPAPESPEEPASERRKPLLVVEYVNAYCPHCRATHRRLERVADELGVPVRWRRVYVWRGRTAPLWARACIYAQSVGLEDRFFGELIQARSSHKSEVFAAARRAGLDMAGLQRAVASGTTPARLTHDRRIARATRITRLPTIDVGRRRLMGEQTEAELRVAMRAALAVLQDPENS